MVGFLFDLQLYQQIILAKNKHRIKNSIEQVLPEALFYFTQGLSQNSIIPESQSALGQDMESQSFITIQVWAMPALKGQPSWFSDSCCTKDIDSVLFLALHQDNQISSAAGLAMVYHTHHLENCPQPQSRWERKLISQVKYSV